MQKAHFKIFLRFLVSFGIGIAILSYVYIVQNKAYRQDCMLKGIDPDSCNLWSKVISDFTDFNISYLILIILLFLASNYSRAVRWKMLISSTGSNIKLSNSLYCVLIGYFANLGLPRAGEFVRAAALAKKENISFSKTMGTVILDRLLDMASIGIIFVITIILSSGHLISFIKSNSDITSKINNFITSPWVWMGALIVFAFAFILIKNIRFRNSRIGKKIISFIKEIIIGLKSIKNLNKPWLFVFHSVSIWVLYFLMNFIGLKAFFPTAGLGLSAALTVFTFGTLGFIIPSPGGMGTYHFLIVESLKLYSISGSDGFSYANIIFFFVQVFGVILFGVIALILLNIKPKEIEDELQKQNIQ